MLHLKLSVYLQNQLTILEKKIFQCFQIDLIETIYFPKNSVEKYWF